MLRIEFKSSDVVQKVQSNMTIAGGWDNFNMESM